MKLVNAELLHKKHPETFGLPDDFSFEQIAPGIFVKVIALQERFWAKILTVKGDQYTGEIANLLGGPHDKNLGDIIKIKKCNVIDILPIEAFTGKNPWVFQNK